MDAPFRCLNCGAAEARPLYQDCRDYYLRTPFRVDYVRCRRCGLVQQSPPPTDVKPFYRSYPVHRAKSKPYDHLRRWLMSRVYCRPPRSARSLLDFGCGDGAYLAQVRRPGMRLAGYEPDPSLAESVAARVGVTVYADEAALARDAAAAPFDFVTMHAVLEHLPDLHAALELVGRVLRRGGTFYFVVPQLPCGESDLFGRRWHGLDPPRHVSFPGPRVVDELAARHGFVVRRCEAVPFPTGFAGSLAPAALGRFSFALMAAALPFTLVFPWIDPSAARAFTLTKR